MSTSTLLALGACLLVSLAGAESPAATRPSSAGQRSRSDVSRPEKPKPVKVTQREALKKLKPFLKADTFKLYYVEHFIYAMKYSEWKIYGITEEELEETKRERSNPRAKERIAYQAENSLSSESNKEQWLMMVDDGDTQKLSYVDENHEFKGAAEFDGWIAYSPARGRKFTVTNEDMADKTKMEPAKNPEMRFKSIKFPESDTLKKFEHSKRFVQVGSLVGSDSDMCGKLCWGFFITEQNRGFLRNNFEILEVEASDGSPRLPLELNHWVLLTQNEKLVETDRAFFQRYDWLKNKWTQLQRLGS